MQFSPKPGAIRAEVSQRTLERAFAETIGIPPSRYLRLRRMQAVRQELRAHSPQSTAVSKVALRWGFNELGRFATEYREFFGELPSRTLNERTRSSRPKTLVL
jgi:AraC family ethanolamine operon transcriptional activator